MSGSRRSYNLPGRPSDAVLMRGAVIALAVALVGQRSVVGGAMRFDGVLLNSGEAGRTLVDFAWQRSGSWSHRSDAGDGVFLDEKGHVWSAGADGVGKDKVGYIYRYSPDGRVLAKYTIGPGLSLFSKLAGDDRFLYFLACKKGLQQKHLYKLDRAVSAPGSGAVHIALKGVALRHWSLDQVAGHLYRGKLYVSVNAAEPKKVIQVDAATGQWSDALTFPPDATGQTTWVQLVDVNPNNGTIYANRRIRRRGGQGVHGLGNTFSECYLPSGGCAKRFVHMHVSPYLSLTSWTRGLVFDADYHYLLMDVRFGDEPDEDASFNVRTDGTFVGYVNQVRTDRAGNVYAAGCEGRTVMVYGPAGRALRRLGALRASALEAGPDGQLYFAVPEGVRAFRYRGGRGWLAVGRMDRPSEARGHTPPARVVWDTRFCELACGLGVDDQEVVYYLLAEKGAFAIHARTNRHARLNHLLGSARVAPGVLTEPRQLALWTDRGNKRWLYVVDSAKGCVLRMRAFRHHTEAKLERLTLVDRSAKPVALRSPRAIALAGDGSLYVADHGAVYRFATGKGATFRLDWRLSQFGDNDAFRDPAGLAVRGTDLFVADTGHHRVLWFTTGGRLVGRFGHKDQPGPGREQLNHPTALAAIGSHVYVADEGNWRIVRLALVR